MLRLLAEFYIDSVDMAMAKKEKFRGLGNSFSTSRSSGKIIQSSTIKL